MVRGDSGLCTDCAWVRIVPDISVTFISVVSVWPAAFDTLVAMSFAISHWNMLAGLCIWIDGQVGPIVTIIGGATSAW